MPRHVHSFETGLPYYTTHLKITSLLDEQKYSIIDVKMVFHVINLVYVNKTIRQKIISDGGKNYVCYRYPKLQ